MRRTSTVVALLAAAVLGGCAQTDSASPPPTTVKDADPCVFVAESLIKKYRLKKEGDNKAETSRSCGWTSDEFSAMVLVRWDGQSLVDFSTAFPVLGDNVELGGVPFVMGSSDVRPACGALFFAEPGTIVEIVAGGEAPYTVADACARVKELSTSVVRAVRDQGLYKQGEETSAPPTS